MNGYENIGDASIAMGDCLELMKSIPDGSVDMILCDLPYGTTACKWDSVIPFDLLWNEYRRVTKNNAAIVLTASQPFTTALISSNMSDFRYCWVWSKSQGTGFGNAKKMPLKSHEDIAVFYRKLPQYNPQGLIPERRERRPETRSGGETMGKNGLNGKSFTQEFTNWPKSVVNFSRDGGKVHPTQKPVALMEYLVRTYTNEREIVLDNTMGSGTTGVACMNTNRKFIGIEKEPKYYEIAKNRIETAQQSKIVVSADSLFD